MAAKSKKVATVVDAILARLALGVPLAQICLDKGMPTPLTWRNWCDADETIAIAYACARDAGFDVIAADCLLIIDAEPERVVVTTGENRCETRIDSAGVQWQKNRAEIRMKLLAKWDPKRYGEMLKLADYDGSSLNKAAEIEKRRQKVINDG